MNWKLFPSPQEHNHNPSRSGERERENGKLKFTVLHTIYFAFLTANKLINKLIDTLFSKTFLKQYKNSGVRISYIIYSISYYTL